jgi:hypothetical protein
VLATMRYPASIHAVFRLYLMHLLTQTKQRAAALQQTAKAGAQLRYSSRAQQLSTQQRALQLGPAHPAGSGAPALLGAA